MSATIGMHKRYHREAAVYRCFADNGDLLYIGRSVNAISRLARHYTSAPWYQEVTFITVEWYDAEHDAVEAEKFAIQRESPKYNKAVSVPRQVIRARSHIVNGMPPIDVVEPAPADVNTPKIKGPQMFYNWQATGFEGLPAEPDDPLEIEDTE